MYADQIASITSRLDFVAWLDQRGRLLQVDTALPALALIPERMVMVEAVNAPFELTLDCLSTSVQFELKRLIGEQISLRLLQADGSYKAWHGYVFGASQLGADGGLARYRMTMRPWLWFLAYRVDSFVYQDRTALAIIEEVFKDHAQANYRLEVSQPLRTRSLCTQYRESDLAFVTRLLAEEGLSYRVEHLEGDAAEDADARGHARHVLIVSDTAAAAPAMGDVRFARQHVMANTAAQKDAVTAFAAARQVAANAVTHGAWDHKRLAGVAATDTSALELGELPTLEVYDGAGAYRYENADHAERSAGLALAALELRYKQFEGSGSARHFAAGQTFDLIDHPLFGANTTAFDYAGAVTAAHVRADNRFTLTAIEHHATNNLRSQAAELLALTDLEHGTYLNHFHCVPAAAPLVPTFVRKPTAPQLQTALVVGQAGVNHPGVISGMHTHSLDRSSFNQWVIDDASGQLRMRLLASYADAELGLGHLIQQSASSAQRGGWRGAGFEATTQGWATVRAAQGLLVSATARPGTYGSARGTQMDAAEALAQLEAARDLGLRIGQAAHAAGAHPLASFEDGESVPEWLAQIDPKKEGRHADAVNGQPARKADGRVLGDPVEAFASPVVLMESPSAALLATEAGVTVYAGQDFSLSAQGDVQQTAAHTWTSVTGKTTSWYVHSGGVKVIAANGPVSLRAHTDALQIRAEQDLTVISVNDQIMISASTKIEVIAGQSSMTLTGGDIEFRTPGAFTVRAAGHAFLGAGSAGATPPHLPTGRASGPPETVQAYHDGEPTRSAEYTARLGDGSVRTGRLDAAGFLQLDDVPAGAVEITVSSDPRPYEKFKLPAVADDDMNAWEGA